MLLTCLHLHSGNGAGAPVAGALLKATGHSWRAVACIMGGMQVLGALFLLYRTHRGSVMQFACTDIALLAARFKREPKLVAVF